MRHIISSTKELNLLFAQLTADDDKLIPLQAGMKVAGQNYWRVYRLIERGELDSYNVLGQRYVKRSDLEDLEPPRRGRPPKHKRLTPEQMGHII